MLQYYLQVSPVNKYKQGHIWVYAPADFDIITTDYLGVYSSIVTEEDKASLNYSLFGQNIYRLISNIRKGLWEMKYFYKNKDNLVKFLPLTEEEANSDFFYALSVQAMSAPTFKKNI